MTQQELKDFVKKEMQDIHAIITERVENIMNEPTLPFQIEELLSGDMDSELLTYFDKEDMENHAYDVGAYKAYEKILEKL